MNWITITWTMNASACLTVALLHLAIWLNDRKSIFNLFFAAAAVSIAVTSVCELQMILAQTPEQFGRWLRWINVPLFFTIVSIVGFVRSYLKAGRPWLAWSICALGLVICILNFVFSPNLNYVEITSLRRLDLYGGATAAVPAGVVSSWARLGEIASLLLLLFVIDASIAIWRRGSRDERRRAVIVGGSVAVFVLVGAGHVALIHAGIITMPYIISLAFLVPVAAMGCERAHDVVRSVQLARDLESSRAELREDREQMELAAGAAELGVWRWDIAGDEVWINDRGRALLGLNGAKRMKLADFMSTLVPADRDSARQSVVRSLDTGTDYEGEYRVRMSGGAVRWIAARGRVEFDGGLKPVALRGVSFDITRRKEAEERFRVVVEAAPNAMIVVNSQGAIVLTNTKTEMVFGYPRQELMGQAIETLVPVRIRAVHEDDGYEDFTSAESIGVGRELYGRRKDGSEFPAEISLNPVQTSEGTLTLASVVDITQRRQAERDQVRQLNELAHLSRVAMLGELSGSLAHELNQPLTAILSNAQAAQEFLAQEVPNLDEIQGILQDIVAEDRRAREVIRRLRLLFRKGEVQFEELDLNELVLEVLKLMNSDLVNHGVSVLTELATGLPSVNGDRVQLQQVLINLIVNASDAMADNEDANRRLCVRTFLQEDAGIGMSVSDTGCGIPNEQIERVFEPFHTTKAKGMGLGLAVCRTIVSAHSGKLWATNNPDQGACLHLNLPSLFVGAP